MEAKVHMYFDPATGNTVFIRDGGDVCVSVPMLSGSQRTSDIPFDKIVKRLKSEIASQVSSPDWTHLNSYPTQMRELTILATPDNMLIVIL